MFMHLLPVDTNCPKTPKHGSCRSSLAVAAKVDAPERSSDAETGIIWKSVPQFLCEYIYIYIYIYIHRYMMYIYIHRNIYIHVYM